MSSSEAIAYAVLTLTSLLVGYAMGARPTQSKKGGDVVGLPSIGEEARGLSGEKPSMVEDCKMVLVVRTDLGMSVGKVAAQCSHATLACYQTLWATNPALIRQWERMGQTKIALQCDSEEELLLLQAKARSLNICARSIQDAGRTQIAAGSRTVLGIGPGPARLINQVTGKLRLL